MKITKRQLRRIIKEEIDNGLVREHVSGWVDSHRKGGKFSGVGGKDYTTSYEDMNYAQQLNVGRWIYFNKEQFFSEEAQNHGVSVSDSKKIWRNNSFQNLLKKLGIKQVLEIEDNTGLSAKMDKVLWSDSLTDGNVTERDIDDAVAGVSEILASEGIINKPSPKKKAAPKTKPAGEDEQQNREYLATVADVKYGHMQEGISDVDENDLINYLYDEGF